MNVGSLFSGIGGIELGFEEAGFTTEWFVERDLYAKQILEKRFPNAKIFDDVENIDFGEVPKVDILTGGFPCQDISNAGKRVGIEGDRSSLWKYYFKAISTIRPKIAFIENVSALLGRGLSVVLCDLASVGYDAEWHCVPASAVGANHQRDRIFIVAYLQSNRGRGMAVERGQNKENPNTYRQSKDVSNPHIDGYKSQGPEQGGIDRNRKEKNQEQSPRKQGFGIGRQDPIVENTISNRMYERDRKKINRREESKKHPDKLISSSTEISNSNKQRQQGRREVQIRCEKFSRAQKRGFWSTEPSVGRVAHGIPLRVDRIKCLGNAVVPQIAEIFAEAIKRKEEGWVD